jgi:hypothetical protein
MNRGLLIVKERGEPRYFSTGVHWSYGESLQKWLEENCPTYEDALTLVLKGSLSSVAATADWKGRPLNPPRPLYHTERGDSRNVSYTKSRKEAFASWENITTHYFSRGKWIMTGSE